MISYCQTDVGIKRNMNQDFVYASDQPVGNLHNLFIVADGMGGHAAGDYASRCAVETFIDFIENTNRRKIISILDGAVQEANLAVFRKSMEDKSMAGMGTTLVAATVWNGCLYVANVGDSRLYLLEDTIEQITKDHSLVEEMVRGGQLTKEAARTHPEKNVITRAIGMKDKIRADFFDVDLVKGDTFLLCSDGLTNMVTDQEIWRIVHRASSLEEAGKKLIDEANANGGSDNISVILAQPASRGV